MKTPLLIGAGQIGCFPRCPGIRIVVLLAMLSYFKALALPTNVNFLKVWMTILALLTALYILLHSFLPLNGGLIKKLPLEDVTILNSLSDTSAVFVTQATQYLTLKYDPDPAGTKTINNVLHGFDKKGAIAILTQTGIESRSFFWLLGDSSFLEIIFWSLFGVICSYLYYFVENYKKGSLDEKEYPSYVSKMLYTPFVTIILYISPSIFTKDVSFTKNMDYWTLVIAFILGFFSGRAVELLDKIKNFLFPYRDGQDDNATKVTTGLIPQEVYVEAVKEKSQEWDKLYGPIEGVSVAKKVKDGATTEEYALQFHVLEKRTNADPSRNIPDTISFVWKNTTYALLTDVVEVEPAKANGCYSKLDDEKFIGGDLTNKYLGLSCSRNANLAAGTIGFKAVSRDPANTRQYLLSCYHVLCNNELMGGQVNVDNATNEDGFRVVTPEFQETGSAPFAFIRQGILDGQIDAAVAELIRPELLNNIVFTTSFIPRTAVIIGEFHVDTKYQVLLAGRTSCRQQGFILSDFTNVKVQYFNASGALVKEQQFEGVIKTCKISTFGDSGAPVVDLNGNAVGLLFASDDEYSYILPILRVFSRFNLKFPK